MKKSLYVLALDPSGSFEEGKGTTGYCLQNTDTKEFVICGSIFAKNFSFMEEYWQEVVKLVIDLYKEYKAMIVIEDYLLYAHKAESQIMSRMETSKLIGCLQLYCWQYEIPYCMQMAGEVKNRWSNDILHYKGYIEHSGRTFKPTSGIQDTFSQHSIDAIRHAVHYTTFKNKGE